MPEAEGGLTSTSEPKGQMNEEAKLDMAHREDFPVMTGMRYLRFLRRLHETRQPNWYLEIGTYTGASLEIATCRSIAVDPEFRVRREIVGTKPALHCLAMTSDDFFQSGFAEAIGAKIDLAFLDGMHRFECLLRDFIGAERIAAPDGMIVMHDCCPVSYIGAEREWDTGATRQWTGDVWKIIPILRRYRPDLSIRTVDCPPSGLVLVSGLDPANTQLREHYERIVSEYEAVRLTAEVLHDLRQQVQIEPSRQYFANEDPGGDLPKPVDVSIKVPAPRQETARQWGEFHFGNSLAKALHRQGYTARVDCLESWESARKEGEFELVLRGQEPLPVARNSQSLWILSHAERIDEDEIRRAEAVFCASSVYEPEGKTVTPLLHCTDPEIFSPRERISNIAHEVLFVGACYPQRRRRGIVRWAVDAGLPVSVIGARWGWLPDGWWIRRHVRNERLGALYSSAGVVLNDHPSTMRERGFVNNRVFDVLACATPLVSDVIEGLPEGFEEFIYCVGDAERLRDAVDAALSENPAMKKRRVEFSQHVREQHSFDSRAAVIVEQLGLRPAAQNQIKEAQDG
jgi:glycosyltransferase involved in cell wall biosynthesis